MKKLENQTLYQCSYCKKRLLSKKGCLLHENDYCWHPDSPHQQRLIEAQRVCKHPQSDTVYRYIPGEAVQEPDYEMCVDCGARF